ncbi:unnamed protein product, partial [Sphacelaria rigidula]
FIYLLVAPSILAGNQSPVVVGMVRTERGWGVPETLHDPLLNTTRRCTAPGRHILSAMSTAPGYSIRPPTVPKHPIKTPLAKGYLQDSCHSRIHVSTVCVILLHHPVCVNIKSVCVN